jgi:hypothetical protein
MTMQRPGAFPYLNMSSTSSEAQLATVSRPDMAKAGNPEIYELNIGSFVVFVHPHAQKPP